MTDAQKLALVYEWRNSDEDLRRVINVMCAETNPAELQEKWPEEFDDLFDLCQTMKTQLGDDVVDGGFA